MSDNVLHNLDKQYVRFYRLAVKDVSVELSDEFDRNFQRQAFFNEAWTRRKRNDDNSRGLLMQSGALRRSIRSHTQRNVISWRSDVPYAALHNEGGVIDVTAKMKRYFWYRYMVATGAMSLKRDGQRRNNARNRVLAGEASFYKAMALKKVGSKINIPRRQFIGMHPHVQKAVVDILNQTFNEVFK